MDKKKLSEHIKSSKNCSVWIVKNYNLEGLEFALHLIKKNIDIKNNQNELANILNEKINIELIGVFMGTALKNKAIKQSKFKYIKIESNKESNFEYKKDIMICQYKKNSVTSRAIYQNSLSYKYKFYLVDSLDTIPEKHREVDFIFD